ncbi:MAG: glycosyltransferase family 9 protein, partial [Proteobacteria bacterium]|nr:glycosyltransferase family 9 protein [Pseudomonadota bacterium]
NPWSFAFSHKVPFVYGAKGKPGPHEVERVLSTISAFADSFKDPPKLYPTAQDFAAIAAWDKKPFITISPATVWPTKMTPLNVWVEASNQFSGEVTFVILGGPSDLNLCESLKTLLSNKHSSRNIVNLAGKITLLQSAALISKAMMNFTNDSAPLHLASAMQAPVTASFCSTIPEFGFGPFNDNGKVIQTAEDLSCRPCGLHGHKVCPMRHFRCGNIQIKT